MLHKLLLASAESDPLVSRSQIICLAVLGLLTCLVILGTTGIVFFNHWRRGWPTPNTVSWCDSINITSPCRRQSTWELRQALHVYMKLMLRHIEAKRRWRTAAYIIVGMLYVLLKRQCTQKNYNCVIIYSKSVWMNTYSEDSFGAPPMTKILCFPQSSEYLNLCSFIQVWRNDDTIVIFGWNCPFYGVQHRRRNRCLLIISSCHQCWVQWLWLLTSTWFLIFMFSLPDYFHAHMINASLNNLWTMQTINTPSDCSSAIRLF